MSLSDNETQFSFSVKFNYLCIYVLSPTTSDQLQTRHEYNINNSSNKKTQDKNKKKQRKNKRKKIKSAKTFHVQT
jgi:hypothetical protein